MNDADGRNAVLATATAVNFAQFGARVVLSPFVLAIAGVFAGLYFVVGTALLARRFENRGRALGVHSAGGPLAGIALPIVATAVAAQHDWRAGVAVGGVVAVGAFFFVVGVVGETPPAAPNVPPRRRLLPRRVLTRFTRPGVAFTILLAILGMYAFQSFISFSPRSSGSTMGLPRGRPARPSGSRSSSSLSASR